MPSDAKGRGERETRLQRPASTEAAYRLANPAVERASSVFFSDLNAFEAAARRRFDTPYYGRYGTTTTFEVETLVAEMEGADKTYGTASGHAAITAALLTVLAPGDHILLPDCAYEPTRHAAETMLRHFGIEVGFYPGRIGREVEHFCKSTTRMIWIEAPGSLTYEIPEIDEIVGFARSQDIITAADNTWASSWLFQPLAHGIEFSIVSATKYMSGHGDVFGGFISTTNRHRGAIERTLTSLGAPLAPDSAYLIQRGLRTLPMRMRHQASAAVQIATALGAVHGISEVMCPALPSSPDHGRWKTYFSGANGLLTFALDGVARDTINVFASSLRHFHLGVSWGGVESLVWPKQVSGTETCGKWFIRLSIGLEAQDDLMEDLRQALATALDNP